MWRDPTGAHSSGGRRTNGARAASAAAPVSGTEEMLEERRVRVAPSAVDVVVVVVVVMGAVPNDGRRGTGGGCSNGAKCTWEMCVTEKMFRHWRRIFTRQSESSTGTTMMPVSDNNEKKNSFLSDGHPAPM